MRDSLQRISGINPEIEKLLNVQGVTRFSQIAQWGKPEIERFDRLLGHPGRVPRENWVEQAQILAKGGDTAYSREFDRRHGTISDPATPTAAPAAAASPSDHAARTPPKLADAIRENQSRTVDEQPQRTSDLSSLRSVRAPAFRAAEQSPPAAREGTGVRAVRSAVPDDLKRIRGIGVLIEKKLNSMGVTSYEQVANWSVADIERVSHLLDFKGRIERENWVEQARILASGGQTEFSRRTDGGESV